MHRPSHIVILVLVLLTKEGKNEDACSDLTNTTIKCVTVDIDDIYRLSALKHFDGETTLIIANSNLSHIESLPTMNLHRFLISNNNINSFNKDCCGDLIYDTLDASHNNLRETNILNNKYPASNIRVDLSFNHISCFKAFNNGHFRYIDLSYNRISNCSRFNSLSISFLNLSRNGIEDLAGLFRKVSYIEKLDLSFNKLKKIVLSDLTDDFIMHYLNVSNNQLIYIAPEIRMQELIANNNLLPNYRMCTRYYVFDETLIIPNPNYISMHLGNNNFSNLEFLISGKCEKKILTLSLNRNRVTKIIPNNFDGYILNDLDLSENQIEAIDPTAFLNAKIFGSLNLSLNRVKIFEPFLSKLPDLKNLILSNNPIRDLNISFSERFLKLENLYLSNCSLTSLNSTSFESLHLNNLDLSYNSIRHIRELIFYDSDIKYLDLSHNNISSFDELVFDGSIIKKLNLEGLLFHEINQSYFYGLRDLRVLNLTDKGIKKIHGTPFDHMYKLKSLYLDNNHLEGIPKEAIAEIPSGENIAVSLVGNRLTRIEKNDFSLKSDFKYLNISITGKLIPKGFSRLFNLVVLRIINSSIEVISENSFFGLTRLKTISFENSVISKVEAGAFQGLPGVTKCNCRDLFKNVQVITTKIFLGLTSLDHLNLTNTGITNVENDAFLGLISLKILNISHNKISELPENAFSGLFNLKDLDISHNNLTGKQSTFPTGIFKDVTKLERLHLQYNKIHKFHFGELSSLQKLRFLNLSNNQLSYLDRHLLFSLKSLETLDINSNNVIKFDYEFSIGHLNALKTVGIGENKWRCENLTLMLDKFSKSNIDYVTISNLDYGKENVDGISCVYLCKYLYCPTEEDLVIPY